MSKNTKNCKLTDAQKTFVNIGISYTVKLQAVDCFG